MCLCVFLNSLIINNLLELGKCLQKYKKINIYVL